MFTTNRVSGCFTSLFDRSFPVTDSNASPPEAGPSPLREAVMSQGRFVFTQLVQHLPLHTFRRLVAKYDGQRYVKRFSCLDQFLCMAFAQLTRSEEHTSDLKSLMRISYAVFRLKTKQMPHPTDSNNNMMH